jgi:tRNA(Arg) A34 adenosine deaminase TadA
MDVLIACEPCIVCAVASRGSQLGGLGSFHDSSSGTTYSSLHCMMARSGPREANSQTHLHVGKALGLSMDLHDQELGPCEGLQQGLGET